MKEVIAIAIGETGAGKSANGCGYLNVENVLIHDESPNSVTTKTIIVNNIIDDINYGYIDCPGIFSSDNDDKKYIKKTVKFLKNKIKGVNAFFITLNVHNKRFNKNLQLMLKYINYLFKNPNIWKQTALIFTHCFQGTYNREILEKEMQPEIVKYIKSLSNCKDIDFELPIFCVDSVKFKDDVATIEENQRIYTKM